MTIDANKIAAELVWIPRGALIYLGVLLAQWAMSALPG
jgi:hypothetical protein